jgi:hypothetical protein
MRSKIPRSFGRLNVRSLNSENSPFREIIDDEEPENKKIIFDPIPRVKGIEPSADPLLNHRAAIYLMSGRRRYRRFLTRVCLAQEFCDEPYS